MENKIIAAPSLVFGLMMSSHVIAQNVDKPSAAPNTWQIVDKAQINDWKSARSTPGSSNQVTNRSNLHLSLAPASSTTDALQRVPFYATAPYWLPHSRSFKARNDTYAVQPATHGALVNDVVDLVRSASSN
jgi:hypothetical protein